MPSTTAKHAAFFIPALSFFRFSDLLEHAYCARGDVPLSVAIYGLGERWETLQGSSEISPRHRNETRRQLARAAAGK